MTWHGQINRTIWEIESLLQKRPSDFKLGRELLRAYFLQRFEFDRSLHVPRDDRSFLFLQDEKAPAMLVLHGAHGTPAEVRELGNYFYGKGFTVFCPRLARYDLKNRMVTWESWVTAAENALTTVLQYSPNTILAGLSLGSLQPGGDRGTIRGPLQHRQPRRPPHRRRRPIAAGRSQNMAMQDLTLCYYVRVACRTL